MDRSGSSRLFGIGAVLFYVLAFYTSGIGAASILFALIAAGLGVVALKSFESTRWRVFVVVCVVVLTTFPLTYISSASDTLVAVHAWLFLVCLFGFLAVTCWPRGRSRDRLRR
jgi:hypothetical protein